MKMKKQTLSDKIMKLKTLKDFREEDVENVNNLSTGNYEGLRYFEGRLDLFKKLKAEAVKWLKSMLKKSKKEVFIDYETPWRNFFNITEDDLK